MHNSTIGFRSLGKSGELPDNSVNPYYVDELQRRVSVARIDGKLYAFSDLCTHEGCQLSAGKLTGTTHYPDTDWPPVVIPFFAFRIMVGMGFVMMAISWFGNWLRWRGRLESTRWFLWCAFLAFPTGFVAVLTGWFTAEVGRQPWVVWGLLRTADAMTPTLTGPEVLATLIGYVVVYAIIFIFGALYIYALLRKGPIEAGAQVFGATGSRPMALGGPAETMTGGKSVGGR
jgi:cytochrome d ubiquinol oxidase subunit I